MSVVGFDNIPESALVEPPLTTIDQSIQEMGHLAVELLIDVIEGHRKGRARSPSPPASSCGSRSGPPR